MFMQRPPVQRSAKPDPRLWKALTVVLLLAFTGDAAAAKVYKWVDENGDVHFGDRPTANDAQELNIKSRPPPAPAGQPLINDPNRTSISEVMEEERLRRKETRAKEKEERETRQRNCVLARDKLHRFQESDYLYDIDSSGNRQVLSTARRQAVEQRVRDNVKQFCG